MTDFSFFGSYMSLAYESDDSGRNRWLCLKSLHGVSKARMKSMKIVPVYKGKAGNIAGGVCFLGLHVSEVRAWFDGNYIFGGRTDFCSGGQEKIMGL